MKGKNGELTYEELEAALPKRVMTHLWREVPDKSEASKTIVSEKARKVVNAFHAVFSIIPSAQKEAFRKACGDLSGQACINFLTNMEKIIKPGVIIPYHTIRSLQLLSAEDFQRYLKFIDTLNNLTPELKSAFMGQLFDERGKPRSLAELNQGVLESLRIMQAADNIFKNLSSDKEYTDVIDELFDPKQENTARVQERLKITQYLLNDLIRLPPTAKQYWLQKEYSYLTSMKNMANQPSIDPENPKKITPQEQHASMQGRITAMMKVVRELVATSKNPITQNLTPPSADSRTANFRMKVSDQRDKYMSFRTFKSGDRRTTAQTLFKALDPDSETVRSLTKEQYYKMAFTAIFTAQQRIIDNDASIKHEWLHKTKAHSRLYDVTNELFSNLANQYLEDPDMTDKTWLIDQLKDRMDACVGVLVLKLPKDQTGDISALETRFLANVEQLNEMDPKERQKLLNEVKEAVGERFHYVVDNLEALSELQGSIEPPGQGMSIR